MALAVFQAHVLVLVGVVLEGLGEAHGGQAAFQEGQVVAAKAATFASNDETQTVKFTFTPDQTGRFVYTVSVNVYPDEVVAENNTRSFALKVIRDRVRVLLVAGRPSWDVRFCPRICDERVGEPG